LIKRDYWLLIVLWFTRLLIEEHGFPVDGLKKRAGNSSAQGASPGAGIESV
jgi:hypothetical protein